MGVGAILAGFGANESRPHLCLPRSRAFVAGTRVVGRDVAGGCLANMGDEQVIAQADTICFQTAPI